MKIHIPMILSAYLLSLVLPTIAKAQSKEEQIVRKTYSKLSFAVKVGSIHTALAAKPKADLTDIESRVSSDNIAFELSDFSSGWLSAIRDRAYGDLVTKPSGEDVINIAVGRYTHTDDFKETLQVKETRETGAMAAWVGGPNFTDNWNMTVAEILPTTNAQNKTEYVRYAAYHVMVSFKGRARGYNAMFLFGNGEKPVLALDNVTNNSALTAFVEESVYPAVLLESSLARHTGLANWLRTHQTYDPACRAGQREICCDPKASTCGVAAGDVRDALDKPISQTVRPLKRPRSSGTYSEAPRLVTVALRPPASPITVACEDYDFGRSGPVVNTTNNAQHSTGSHSWHDAPSGSCSYTGPPQGLCIADVVAETNSGLTSSEAGSLTVLNTCHVTATNYVNGSGTGAPVTANTNAAAEAISCPTPCTCTAAITFSGQNPTFTTGNIWNQQNPRSLNCPVHSSTSGSPVVFDTTGRGFHLTSLQNGVEFDLSGTGKPKRIAWTDGISGNAFLALDRNGNGLIDSGKELFGNYTDQPQSDDPNGFLALAVFDDPANGGNGDGVIDEHDSVWSRLKLWIDENHDGISQQSELYTLPELGVFSISLKYVQARRYDQYGNLFRYKGRVNPEGEPRHDKVDRVLYDVYLVSE